MSHDLTEADLICLLSAMIGTFSTVTRSGQVIPLPADPTARGELIEDLA